MGHTSWWPMGFLYVCAFWPAKLVPVRQEASTQRARALCNMLMSVNGMAFAKMYINEDEISTHSMGCTS